MQLLHQRSFLREERRLIRASTDQLEAAKANIENMKKNDWLDAAIVEVNKPESKKRIQLSVGGMVRMTVLFFCLCTVDVTFLSLLCGFVYGEWVWMDGCLHFCRCLRRQRKS